MTSASAIVCTRNRPAAVVHAVSSLLGGTQPDLVLDLLVIDQSDGPETERELARFAADPRLRYRRSRARGKGAALNEGLALAAHEIVVCTDDDCEAPPGWVAAMAAVLTQKSEAALVFCNVVPVPHDATQGYVPAYQRSANRELRRIQETCAGHGLGAGMALRRSAVLGLGGFDESVGPGARFPSGDDWDIEHRLLLKGWTIFETADVCVVHDGFRTFSEGRAHTRRDWTAIGAVCAKPLRAGYWRAAVVPLWVFGVDALWPPVADVLHLRRPRGLIRITGFVSGFWEGMRTPVDRRTLLFRRH
jgi:glycosyltransferase involved in cell wall biosynthesis